MFATVPAASAATDGSDIGAYPVAGTTFAGALDSDFPVYTQLKQNSVTTLFTTGNVVYKVEKTAGIDMDIAFSVSQTVLDMSAETTASQIVDSAPYIVAGATVGTVSASISGTGIAHLNFKASSTSPRASWSPVTLLVTAWIDNQGGAKNDAVDSDELFTTFTVTLGNPTATLTVTQPLEDDTVLTVSSTITGVNLANVKGSFFLAMSSSSVLYSGGAASVLATNATSGSALALKGGVLSTSITVNSISSSQSVSGAVRYVVGSALNIYSGQLAGSVVALAASAAGVDAVNATVLASDNSTASSAIAAAVRPNQTYTIRVHALTGSVSVSGQVVTVALGGTALATGSTQISVNGGAALTAYPDDISVTTGADGYGSFTVATTGFIGGNTLTVDATSGNVASSTLTLTATTPAYSIANDYNLYATTPGTAVNIGFTIEDQWQVAASAGLFQIKATKGGTGFAYAETISNVAVASAAATFAFTPTPVAKTGSAVVSTQLQKWNTDLAAWLNEGAAGTDVTVTVTSTADAMSASPIASTSASVSYFPSTVSYETITGTAKNAGSSVVISGDADSLVFRASAAVTATTSGGITVRAAADGGFTFQVASKHAGTFTLTYGIGATSTTSLLVVDPAADSSGKSISFDTSNIGSGATATLTGTLVDMNGNPVDTSGSATITVAYKGSGIAIGTMPTETDADGEFSVNVLTGATDKGTATLTATYQPTGLAVSTKNITVVHAVTVGGAVAAAADQKVTIGTYKGYVAVFTKGYAGQKLSVRLASKWHVRNPIVDLKAGYSLLTVNTGAGYVANVIVYIDTVEVERMTITTK